jgi:PPOX class probable F420-dependent enzyme
MESIGKSQFMALETFKKNGDGVITPVWVCEINGKMYVWTDANSWKVKRIRNREDVRIASSDARGNPKSEWQSARAQVLENDEWIVRVKKAMIQKYGLQFRLISLSQWFSRHKSTRVALEIFPRI